MPFEVLTADADRYLTESGFEALDALNGVIGGERYGVWDFTWVAHRAYGLCFASMFAWNVESGAYTAQVWAHCASADSLHRSLVLDVPRLKDPPSTDHHDRILKALLDAANRSVRLGGQTI